jgi:hypothetical protein
MTDALAEVKKVILQYSCVTDPAVGNPNIPETLIAASEWRVCDVRTLDSGDKVYDAGFSRDVMPNPYVELEIEEIQPNLLRMTLHFEVKEPDNPDEYRIQTEWTSFRHADSNYENECRYVNKDC